MIFTTAAELEIAQRRAKAEKEFEGDIDKCVATERRVARSAVGRAPRPVWGQGARTLGAKSHWCHTSIWTKRAKIKLGVAHVDAIP